MEKIKALQKGLADFVKNDCLVSIELEKQEGRLKKARDIRDPLKEKLEEAALLLAGICERVKIADPAELPDIYRRRVELKSEEAVIEAQLADLSDMVSRIEADMQPLREGLSGEVLGYLRGRAKIYEREVYGIVHDEIEPRIQAWKDFIADACRKHGLGLDRRMGLEKIMFYSPLVLEAVDKMGDHGLILAAAAYHESSLQSVTPEVSEKKRAR